MCGPLLAYSCSVSMSQILSTSRRLPPYRPIDKCAAPPASQLSTHSSSRAIASSLAGAHTR
eukprot:scaffold825_cov30-Tisochrysis_lutea.AAC.4